MLPQPAWPCVSHTHASGLCIRSARPQSRPALAVLCAMHGLTYFITKIALLGVNSTPYTWALQTGLMPPMCSLHRSHQDLDPSVTQSQTLDPS